MNRVIRNGLVAVLYSPGHGAGWSSWNPEHAEQMVFDPWIVDILISNDYTNKEKTDRILAHCAVKYPGATILGLESLNVKWVPVGMAFRINEYDGSESVEYQDMVDWFIA